jgi:hypothetical protein
MMSRVPWNRPCRAESQPRANAAASKSYTLREQADGIDAFVLQMNVISSSMTGSVDEGFSPAEPTVLRRSSPIEGTSGQFLFSVLESGPAFWDKLSFHSIHVAFLLLGPELCCHHLNHFAYFGILLILKSCRQWRSFHLRWKSLNNDLVFIYAGLLRTNM